MRAGLTGRILIGSSILAVVVGAAFFALLASVADLRTLDRRAHQSERVLVVANRLERLVVDLETGQRGFLLTGAGEFLQPWQAARAAFPGEAAQLERLVAGDAAQEARAARIVEEATAYLNDYSVPLVEAARRDRASVDTLPATQEGKWRVDALRAGFDQLLGAEDRLAAERQRRSDAAANRAVVAAAAGLVGSVALVGLYAWFVARRVAGPVRRVAAMAGRLAAGDLGARVPERGTAEVAVLQRSFNTMAGALERGREELAASRARIVTAADRERRRIERDLHDGIQQRLVSLVLELRAAEAVAPPESPRLREQLAGVARGLTEALAELRELSRGIHPAILSEGGLGPALRALARRSAVPVELDVDVPGRLSEPLEAAAYYVASEALANVAKHARASTAWVLVSAAGGRLRLVVRDDGVGGAEAGSGSGIVGLTDRVQALGGTIALTSPAGGGTTLDVELPLPAAS